MDDILKPNQENVTENGLDGFLGMPLEDRVAVVKRLLANQEGPELKDIPQSTAVDQLLPEIADVVSIYQYLLNYNPAEVGRPKELNVLAGLLIRDKFSEGEESLSIGLIMEMIKIKSKLSEMELDSAIKVSADGVSFELEDGSSLLIPWGKLDVLYFLLEGAQIIEVRDSIEDSLTESVESENLKKKFKAAEIGTIDFLTMQTGNIATPVYEEFRKDLVLKAIMLCEEAIMNTYALDDTKIEDEVEGYAKKLLGYLDQFINNEDRVEVTKRLIKVSESKVLPLLSDRTLLVILAKLDLNNMSDRNMAHMLLRYIKQEVVELPDVAEELDINSLVVMMNEEIDRDKSNLHWIKSYIKFASDFKKLIPASTIDLMKQKVKGCLIEIVSSNSTDLGEEQELLERLENFAPELVDAHKSGSLARQVEISRYKVDDVQSLNDVNDERWEGEKIYESVVEPVEYMRSLGHGLIGDNAKGVDGREGVKVTAGQIDKGLLFKEILTRFAIDARRKGYNESHIATWTKSAMDALEAGISFKSLITCADFFLNYSNTDSRNNISANDDVLKRLQHKVMNMTYTGHLDVQHQAFIELVADEKFKNLPYQLRLALLFTKDEQSELKTPLTKVFDRQVFDSVAFINTAVVFLTQDKGASKVNHATMGLTNDEYLDFIGRKVEADSIEYEYLTGKLGWELDQIVS